MCQSQLKFEEDRVLHCLNSYSSAILNNDLVYLGIASKVQVVIDSTGRMNVGMSTITTSSSLTSQIVSRDT